MYSENLESDQVVPAICSLIKIILLRNFAPLHFHLVQGFNEWCEFAGVPQMANPLQWLWKLKQLWSTKLCVDLNDSNIGFLWWHFAPAPDCLSVRQASLVRIPLASSFHLHDVKTFWDFYNNCLFSLLDSSKLKLTDGAQFHKCLIVSHKLARSCMPSRRTAHSGDGFKLCLIQNLCSGIC